MEMFSQVLMVDFCSLLKTGTSPLLDLHLAAVINRACGFAQAIGRVILVGHIGAFLVANYGLVYVILQGGGGGW